MLVVPVLKNNLEGVKLTIVLHLGFLMSALLPARIRRQSFWGLFLFTVGVYAMCIGKFMFLDLGVFAKASRFWRLERLWRGWSMPYDSLTQFEEYT